MGGKEQTMNKELIRAYFRAYRARINDLEAEVESSSYSMNNAQRLYERSINKMRTSISCMQDDIRNREYDQWRLEDRIKNLERR